MKFIPFILFILAFAVPAAAETPAGHPPLDHKQMTDKITGEEPAAESDHHGKVLTAINVLDTYIYLEVDPDDADENVWIAIPGDIAVKEGDRVRYKDGPVMKDFTSETLKRTFESVMFLATVVVE